MLRAILFDFNGVLLDDEQVHCQLFQRVLAEEGLVLTEDEYYRDFVGFDDEEGFAHAYRTAGQRLSKQAHANLRQRKAQLYLDRIAQGDIGFFPGAVDFVRAASASGLALGIVSGALEQEIRLALAGAGIESLFRTVVAAEAVESSKPDPEGYRLGLYHLRSSLQGSDPLRAREVLAIEDTQAGLQAARVAGLVTVAVEHTCDASHFEGADCVVAQIADLELSALESLFLDDRSGPSRTGGVRSAVEKGK